MIADLNNPKSVRYTEIALESWSKQNILDIEVIQCYTPETIEHLEPSYNWMSLLQTMQIGHESSKSERAGDISHYQLIQKRVDTPERFYVLEHDSYLLNADEFKRQYEFTMKHGLAWANHGLFMSCYSLSREFATYANYLLLNRMFPLNGGPYGCMERLVKTYITDKRLDKQYNWMTHAQNVRHVNVGKTADSLFHTFNYKVKDSPFKLASTQVISKSEGITQEHPGMKAEPWKRWQGFKIID